MLRNKMRNRRLLLKGFKKSNLVTLISFRSQIHLSTCVDYLLNNSIFSGIVCSLTVMLSSIPIGKGTGMRSLDKPTELFAVITICRHSLHQGVMVFMLKVGESSIQRIFCWLDSFP